MENSLETIFKDVLLLNENLVNATSINTAVYFAELEERSKEAIGSVWFSATQKEIAKETKISPFKQNKIVKDLVELGLISYKKMGVPERNFFCIHREVYNSKFL
jgi:DNA-binding Lrp family transcriptional regulator